MVVAAVVVVVVDRLEAVVEVVAVGMEL